MDGRDDLGLCTPEELRANHRSWMIGLAGHGLEAVRSCPGLWETYLSEAGVGVPLEDVTLVLGSRMIRMGGAGSVPPPQTSSHNDDDNDVDDNGNKTVNQQEGYIVDRNFIVAAMARYAQDHMSSSDSCSNLHTFKYGTELLFVDYDNHRVLLRNKATTIEEYVPYDLLVGADGVRSVVREALVKRHVDMELQVSDIFQTFKAAHLPLPKALHPAGMYFLPASLPGGFGGISLPETNGMINLTLGVPRHLFDKIPEDLQSHDPTVVADYLRTNFKAFSLDSPEDYLDWATQWVNQRWNLTGQVYCNRYHSVECGIVMMGDSVHATSPSIGMGMNTALRDAQKFNELLDMYDDDLDTVLPQYSMVRVPEGNALTNLAMNLFCFDTRVYARTLVMSIVRSGLNYLFPRLVDPDPNVLIGMPQYTLADIYDMATRHGIITKHREINMRIRQEFFERKTGMVKETKSRHSFMTLGMYAAVTVIVPAAIYIGVQHG